MPRKQDEWVSGQEAARILTRHTDHEVSAAYVRILAMVKGKIRYRPVNDRENEYWRADVDEYRVRPRNTPRVRPRPGKGEKAKEEAVA